MRRAWLAALLIAVGCGGAKQHRAPLTAEEPAYDGPWDPPPAARAGVIATVDGEKIYEDDVARQAAARGIGARQALDELIEETLLAQEARRRGLAGDPDVVRARKQARVRLMMDRDFLPTFASPDAVPQAEVDRAWADHRIQLQFNHEHYQQVSFARVCALPPGKTECPNGAEADELRPQADALRAQLALERFADKDAFKRRATEIGAEMKLHVDLGDFQLARHDSAVESFSEAAYSIHDVGEVSQPYRTEWGWDIIYLWGVIEERHTTKAEAEPEIRAHLYRDSQRAAFLHWSDRFLAGRTITTDESWLERIDPGAPIDVLHGGR